MRRDINNDRVYFGRFASICFNPMRNTSRKASRRVRLSKPTSLLLHVINDRDVTYTYDVTIEKAQ